MGKILSQEEVRALLQQPGDELETGEGEAPPVTTYDFRNRQHIPRGQLRHLKILHERFAQELGPLLSAYLRRTISFSLESMEQMSARNFIHSLPDPTMIFLAETPTAQSVAIVFDNEISLAFAERLMGGPGSRTAGTDAASQIEQSVLETLAETVLEALRNTWRPGVELELALSVRETRPALVPIHAPEDGFVTLYLKTVFTAADTEVAGGIRFAIPLAIAGNLTTDLASHAPAAEDVESWSTPEARELEAKILEIPVTVRAELTARPMATRDLLQLKPGLVVKLGRSVTEPTVLKVEGISKFEGVLAVSQGHRAVEIGAAGLGEPNE